MPEPRETASEVTDEAKAALQAVVESGQAQWYLSGGLEQIEFTAEGFCRWHAAEVARVRAKCADELVEAARLLAGSREASEMTAEAGGGLLAGAEILRGEQP